MTQRTEKEMSALLAKVAEQIGPLDKWSEQALEVFNDWLKKTSGLVEHEWVERDVDTDADY